MASGICVSVIMAKMRFCTLTSYSYYQTIAYLKALKLNIQSDNSCLNILVFHDKHFPSDLPDDLEMDPPIPAIVDVNYLM